MGFLEFVIFLFVVLAIAAGVMWCIGRFIQNPPAWAGTVVWGVALFIIVVTLLRVTGVWDTILSHDPKIPSLK